MRMSSQMQANHNQSIACLLANLFALHNFNCQLRLISFFLSRHTLFLNSLSFERLSSSCLPLLQKRSIDNRFGTSRPTVVDKEPIQCLRFNALRSPLSSACYHALVRQALDLHHTRRNKRAELQSELEGAIRRVKMATQTSTGERSADLLFSNFVLVVQSAFTYRSSRFGRCSLYELWTLHDYTCLTSSDVAHSTYQNEKRNESDGTEQFFRNGT
jgi:hypothetical protein